MRIPVLFLLLIVLIAGCTSITYIPEREGREETVPEQEEDNLLYNGTITGIIDADTIRVDGVRMRLALINAPEIGKDGYEEAKDFFSSNCPVGSTVWIDEDDGQGRDRFGRLLVVVYCDNRNFNEQLLLYGHAVIDEEFCDVSEFGDDVWARTFGC